MALRIRLTGSMDSPQIEVIDHYRHDRHPDCLKVLPKDSCHWEGCDYGVSASDRLCFHRVGRG